MTEDKELRFEWKGPDPDGRKAESGSPTLLSEGNLHLIIVRAWTLGRYHPTQHFKEMGRRRNFNVIDAEHAIRRGKLRDREYCPDFSNWKCRVVGPVDDKQLEVVVALDDLEDYHDSPLIILVTGYWK